MSVDTNPLDGGRTVLGYENQQMTNLSKGGYENQQILQKWFSRNIGLVAKIFDFVIAILGWWITGVTELINLASRVTLYHYSYSFISTLVTLRKITVTPSQISQLNAENLRVTVELIRSSYITNAMPRLSGSLVFLPSHKLLWIVNASMVTVKLFVWIWVNFFPPELYLKYFSNMFSVTCFGPVP